MTGKDAWLIIAPIITRHHMDHFDEIDDALMDLIIDAQDMVCKALREWDERNMPTDGISEEKIECITKSIIQRRQ